MMGHRRRGCHPGGWNCALALECLCKSTRELRHEGSANSCWDLRLRGLPYHLHGSCPPQAWSLPDRVLLLSDQESIQNAGAGRARSMAWEWPARYASRGLAMR